MAIKKALTEQEMEVVKKEIKEITEKKITKKELISSIKLQKIIKDNVCEFISDCLINAIEQGNIVDVFYMLDGKNIILSDYAELSVNLLNIPCEKEFKITLERIINEMDNLLEESGIETEKYKLYKLINNRIIKNIKKNME